MDRIGEGSCSSWLVEVARWYESDLQMGLRDGVMPSAEEFLNALRDEDRNEASRIFDSIHSYYRDVFPADKRKHFTSFSAHSKSHLSAEDHEVGKLELTQGATDRTRAGGLQPVYDGVSPSIPTFRLPGHTVLKALGKAVWV